MSTRRTVTLIALVWIAAAGLMVLPYVWPWYRHQMPWIDQPLVFASGWLWHGRWAHRRAASA